MKKLLTLALALLMPLCTLCACGTDNGFSGAETLSDNVEGSQDPSVTYSYAQGATEPPSGYNSYADSAIDLSLRLFRNTAKQTDEDFVLSTAGSVMQLAQLTNAAANDTRSEMLLAFGSSLTTEALNQCSSYFRTRMESVSSSGKDAQEEHGYIRLQNTLFLNDKTDVKNNFLKQNADFYADDIFRFRFADAGEKIDTYYGGSISAKQLGFANHHSMLGCETTALRDSWLTAYPADALSKGTFRSGNKEQELLFMQSNESYLHTDKAEGVQKFTADNPLKLLFIMPKEDMSLHDYLKSFDVTEYASLVSSLDITQTVSAQIPQFSVKEQLHALSAPLTRCGFYTLFGKDSDWSNMAHNDISLEEIYQHMPTFTCNAGGITTEAAVADTDTVSAAGGKADIRFDRPFLFIVADNESGIPLYMGIYS